MRLLTFCLFAFLFANSLSAQKLPKTNVYLFDINVVGDSTFEITNAKYLTAFNSEGYNNQPFFMNDEEIYLTVQMANDTTQSDIYALNLETGVKTQVTNTPESEYSPTYRFDSHINPKSSAEFSCIRVATDENATQRLWTFPLDRSNNGKVIFKTISDIGYHQWMSLDEAALFIVVITLENLALMLGISE